MLPFVAFAGGAIALTSGQKVAVKIATKSAITIGTAVASATAYSAIVNSENKKQAEETNRKLLEIDRAAKTYEERIEAGEASDLDILRLMKEMEGRVPTSEDIARLQKATRRKASVAATGIAGVGAAASVGADILLNKYL